MAQVLLILTIFASHLHLPLPSAAKPHQRFLVATLSGTTQTDRPLNLNQIEELLKLKLEDENVAREIRKLGIDFRVDPLTLDRLLKLGAGEQTRLALLQQEERAAHSEFSTEKEPAKQQSLGREFLRKYPRSSEAAKVTEELRKIELKIFETAYRTFSNNPGAAGLEQVLTMGRELLSRQSDRATAVQVLTKLAMATSKGMIGNFHSDLEQSRDYAIRALELLETPTPPPQMDRQTYSQLRAESLGVIYQSLGLYQFRQPVPDPEQAINFLTKAAELKDSPSANDPITYWLRALARDLNFQKLSDEFRALPKDQRVGRTGQSLCIRIEALFNQLFSDYTQVLTLSGRADSPQLKDEAVAALKLLVTGERPCQGGRGGLIDEWPAEENRTALVIGVEDHLDKQIGKLNYAASDARAVTDALVRHGGFRKEQVVLLATGEPADRQPVRSVMLQQLAELPNRVRQDGLLLVYFVGHAFESAGRAYLLAADSLTGNDSLLSDTAIPAERLKEMIRKSGAGQVVLIFDAFRRTPVSESFSRSLSFDVRKNEVTAFATLLSASIGQRAYESPAKKHGAFTSVFLEAVKGKAANKNRDVTMDSLINYLRTAVPQETLRESGDSAQQLPSVFVEGYEADELVMFLPDSGGQSPAQAAAATLAEQARSAKTIHIRSKTIYLNPALLDAELRKLPEFQALKLKLVNDPKEADLVIEITLPFLTWMWNFTVTHRSGNTPLISGKLRELTAAAASPKLARELTSRLQAARD